MKKVVSGNDLRNKLQNAVDLLCDTVKMTLGPKGSNIIIDHSSFSPFITNDGVTIAENIESEDEIINTILELAKEASIKTNEVVGDGTTTTLVLLQSIFNNGLNLINDGVNQMVIKKELDKIVEKLIIKIKKESRKCNVQEIEKIVNISANDYKIGKDIMDAYLRINNVMGIKITEGNDSYTKIQHLKGYTFETDVASPYYFINASNINLKDVKILLIENSLYDIEFISNILNLIIKEKKNFLIIAKDYGEQFINDIMALNEELEFKIYLIKSPYYGKEEKYFYDDIKDITNCKIINCNVVDYSDLGDIKTLNINRDYINIEFVENETITKKVNLLENNELDDFNKKRISMLKNGIVNIIVGDKTITERREKKMRYDDALCALKSLDDGVIPGSGVVLYKLSKELENSIGDNILKVALKEPLKIILINAGLEYEEIISNIKNNNFTKIYNVNKEIYEEIKCTEVLDSTKVVINSLTNAISIAGMLLTTNSLVINEYQNNINKMNEYNEL